MSLNRKDLINMACATAYNRQGFDVGDEIDLSDSTHPQEIALYNMVDELVDTFEHWLQMGGSFE